MKSNALFLLLFVSVFSLRGQSDSSKFKLLVIGIESISGFDKAKELFSGNQYSENLKIKSGYTPKMGLVYKLTRKVGLSIDVNYSFYKSSTFDTTLNKEVEEYVIKRRGVGVSVGVDYYFVIKKYNQYGILANFYAKKLNSMYLPDFIINSEEYKKKGGFKLGLVYYRLGSSVRFFYSRLGQSNMLGAELFIPIKRW